MPAIAVDMRARALRSRRRAQTRAAALSRSPYVEFPLRDAMSYARRRQSHAATAQVSRYASAARWYFFHGYAGSVHMALKGAA